MIHDAYMREALALADVRRAPVKCRLARSSSSTARSSGEEHDQPIGAHDPTAHARWWRCGNAAATVGNYRLTGRDAVRDGRAVPDVRGRARARAGADGRV